MGNILISNSSSPSNHSIAQFQVQIDPNHPLQTVEAVRQVFKQNLVDVQLSGHFFLTKAGGSKALTFDFKREFETEALAKLRLLEAAPWAKILERFQTLHPTVQLPPNYLPDTYAVTLKSCSEPQVTRYNVFLPFPKVLNADIDVEHCTIEFVDKWRTFFDHCITPCVQHLFTENSIQHYQSLMPNGVERTAYAFSLLHELAHRFGAFRVIPAIRSDIHVSTFQLNMLSELQANALVIHHVPELLEFQAFWLFHHIFLHARWGTKNNLKSGWIEVDNDSCLGAYVAEKAVSLGVIEWNESKLTLRTEKIHALATTILTELENLTLQLEQGNDHQSIVQLWIEQTIPKDKDGLHFSRTLQEIFSRLTHVPEATELRE